MIGRIWVTFWSWAPVLISPMVGVLKKEPYILLYLFFCYHLYPLPYWSKGVFKEETTNGLSSVFRDSTIMYNKDLNSTLTKI